jgi:lantibiotic biosynthesis protein
MAPAFGPAAMIRRPLFVGDTAGRALDAASVILARGIARLDATEPFTPGSVDAYGGAALIADALARAGREPASGVENLLRHALAYRPDELSLYGGAAGLLVVLDAVDPQRALRRPRARLCDVLAASIRAQPPPDLADVSAYDLVYGLAGRALALGDREPGVLPELRAWCERFIGNVEERLASDAPDVVVNLGVSHGVPGVLAALNATLPADADRALARRYVDALLAASYDCGDGAARWDAMWHRDVVPPAACSWCYYTPGVAAVLYDRAVLDGDDALRATAVRSLVRVLEDNGDDWSGVGPSMCHGRAGVAVLAWHLAHEDERLAHAAQRLAHTVLAEYDERLPLGYRSYDHADGEGQHRTHFLDASFGIALFLADAATANARPWLPLLGLLPD